MMLFSETNNVSRGSSGRSLELPASVFVHYFFLPITASMSSMVSCVVLFLGVAFVGSIWFVERALIMARRSLPVITIFRFLAFLAKYIANRFVQVAHFLLVWATFNRRDEMFWVFLFQLYNGGRRHVVVSSY